MKNKVYDIFEEDLASTLEGLTCCLDEMNLTTEQLVDKLSDMDEIDRDAIYFTAVSSGNDELVDKLEKANDIIKLKRIDEFKESVANGTYEEFLSKMKWNDKSSLAVDLEMLEDERPLTGEERKCISVIEESINNDIRQLALSQGFKSVKAWKEHNALSYRKTEEPIHMLTLLR